MERVPPKPALRRKSVFVEVGLTDEETVRQDRAPAPVGILKTSPNVSPRPVRNVRFRSRDNVIVEQQSDKYDEDSDEEWMSDDEVSDYELDDGTLATMQLRPNRHMKTYQKGYRIGVMALLLALLLPILQSSTIHGLGVRARTIPSSLIESGPNSGLSRRQDTSTEVCKRWSHQTAIVNGTLYIYGGRASETAQQTSDTWNNDFLTLDLTKSWQIGSPSLTGLPRPSGPPEVSNGYLWASHDSLYLYGGEFSDNPERRPTAFSLWEYRIASEEWIERRNPKTSAGVNAEDAGQPVQRSAEGAGFGVSTLGRGWYFGGHLDFLTTEGWSNQVGRVYLRGLIEFTFPGFGNDAVEELEGGRRAGEEGVWRNITEGGMQDTAGFTERADGLLVYIPGFGDEGILLGLAGGTNATFTQMNVIDVYDIARSQWYKQPTSGRTPKYRVNPCAVVAAAADGSSYNVYMYGGQNLIPTGEQVQYDDMWILSVPSFTWVEVKAEDANPPARAGHTCNIWDGQMVVVGGYVGQELSCDTPGIYVFNMSSLTWSTQFTALTGPGARENWSGNADSSANPLGQQANQRGFNSSAGLEGSYGYAVPRAVQEVIGGEETGGATLTAPVQTATEGPLATGRAHTYTVTGPNGAIITQTTVAGAGNSGGRSGPNIGAIVAGVIAGVCAVIAAYFAFCAWIYRKQVKLWKEHAAMAARQNATQTQNSSTTNEKDTLVGGAVSSSAKNSSDRRPDFLLFPSTTEDSAHPGTSSGGGAAAGLGPGAVRHSEERRSSDSSTDDLLGGQEPAFWGARGVLLNPRRSLRVINRD